MSSRGGKPRLRQCPASTKDKPQSGRSPGSRVTAFAPPSQFYGHPFFQWHLEQKLAGYSCGNSAGFPPASLLSTLSRRPGACGGVRRVLGGGQGGGCLRSHIVYPKQRKLSRRWMSPRVRHCAGLTKSVELKNSLPFRKFCSIKIVIVCYEEVIVSNIFMLKSTKGGGRNDP
jgi:hypothetical protein